MISSRRREAGHVGGEVRVAATEALAVPVLEGDPGSQAAVEPGQVVGVEGEPVLVLLGRRADDAEAEEAHFFLPTGLSAMGLAREPWRASRHASP